MRARWFAEELRFVMRARTRATVVEAFATVPRERFVGPGPLRILSLWNMRDYWTPAVASPTAVYHDVMIAYDEKRVLNNGQPSLWAFVFDKLNVVPADRVLHLGCGMGYYTAVLAELAGRPARYSAIEIDEPLAERARERRWPRGLMSRSPTAMARTVRSPSPTSSWPAPGRPIRCRLGSTASNRGDGSFFQ